MSSTIPFTRLTTKTLTLDKDQNMFTSGIKIIFFLENITHGDMSTRDGGVHYRTGFRRKETTRCGDESFY